MDQRVDHRAIVGAVAGGLHHHVAGKTEVIAQRIELLPGCVAGGIFALGRVGELGARTEHMTMRVDYAGRQLEPRF